MKNLSLASFTKYLRSLRYSGQLRPERDWLVLLSVSFILLLGSVGWNVWLFVTVANSENAPESTPVVNTVSSAAAVTNVQNVFKARATEQNNYQQTYTFVDPSH